MADTIVENEEKIRLCKNCGKPFKVKRYYYGKHFTNSNAICCCRKCGYEYAKKNREITCLERYGIKNVTAFGTERHKKAIIEKYGVENVFQSDEIKEKIKQTNLTRYGVEYAMQSEEIKAKSKETCLEKYGVESTGSVKEIKEKAYETCLKRYGVKHVVQSKEWQLKNGKCLQEKRYLTMKKNNTFNTSKQEKKIYDLLKSKFEQVLCEYKSEKYPFKCDFYIPEKDLYIEYQGHQSHGREPYNEVKKEHIEVINKWKKLSENDFSNGKKHSSYLGYIKVWTIRDPLKRKTAKENNLNWLEFFDMNQFMNWYRTLEN